MKLTSYSPDELYARFEDAHDQVTPREFFNKPKHKKAQEFYCAARFGQAYSKVQPCAIHVADHDEQTDADFQLEVAGRLHRFQVTEVQLPGRRRGDEYKQDALPQATLESWRRGTSEGPEWIRDAIQKKCAHYGGDVSKIHLLVYANFQAYEHDFEALCRATADAAAPFASVWVVNGNGACCVKGCDELGPARPWLPSH